MHILVLVDNGVNPEDRGLGVEHGLSFYIEVDGKKMLLDVGASGMFLDNAQLLGVDIAEVDALVLSHAHSDHTGGLAHFLNVNKKAKIYLSSYIDGEKYYSTRRGDRRDISIDYQLLKDNAERIVSVSENVSITPNVQIIAQIPTIYPLPKANRTLFFADEMDDFAHEIALCLKQEGEIVLLSSCTHKGLMNTLKTLDNKNISTFVGGLHLLDSDEKHNYETQDELRALAAAIKNEYPALQIITGHCTGEKTATFLKSCLPDNLSIFYTGFELIK